jgi:RepB DNA-primase from phage plasmid
VYDSADYSAESGESKAVYSTDTDAAIDFLGHWEPEGPWTLTSVLPDGTQKDIETRTFEPDNSELCAAWIKRHNQSRNIYFAANRVEKVAFGKKAAKEELAEIVATHVDADLPGARNEEQEAAILEDLRRHHPTTIVFSGGGYQGVWRLAEPLPAQEDGNIARIEAINRRLIERHAGDKSCWNADRILRLPGTTNWPNEKKRAKGRVPALACLVQADWEKTIYPALPAIEELDATKEKATKAKPEVGTEHRTYEPSGEAVPIAELPENVRRAIETGVSPNSAKNGHNDRSRAVFYVACELVRQNWRDADIAAVLLDPSFGISEHCRAQPKPKRAATNAIEEDASTVDV